MVDGLLTLTGNHKQTVGKSALDGRALTRLKLPNQWALGAFKSRRAPRNNHAKARRTTPMLAIVASPGHHVCVSKSSTYCNFRDLARSLRSPLFPSAPRFAILPRKDAERYRWLRDVAADWKICYWKDSHGQWVAMECPRWEFDAAIDAAMEE